MKEWKECVKCGEKKGPKAWHQGGDVCSHCKTMESDEKRRANNSRMIEIDRRRDELEFKKLMGGMFG